MNINILRLSHYKLGKLFGLRSKNGDSKESIHGIVLIKLIIVVDKLLKLCVMLIIVILVKVRRVEIHYYLELNTKKILNIFLYNYITKFTPNFK